MDNFKRQINYQPTDWYRDTINQEINSKLVDHQSGSSDFKLKLKFYLIVQFEFWNRLTGFKDLQMHNYLIKKAGYTNSGDHLSTNNDKIITITVCKYTIIIIHRSINWLEVKLLSNIVTCLSNLLKSNSSGNQEWD